MNDYEEQKKARIDRYRDRAAKAQAESASLHQQADEMLSAIPPGQPMLVDHYSYQADRRYRQRIGQKIDKAIEAGEKAAYYEQKAQAAEQNTAISADDPEAVAKLTHKLEQLKSSQQFMKKVNAYYRKHQTCRGCEGVSGELAAKLDSSMEKAYSWETAPYPSYALSNQNQEIHRIENRIKQLTQAREVGFCGWESDGGKVVANTDKNRLQVFFDEIPPEDVRKGLKAGGFHWARSEGAWQRQLNNNAIYAARHIRAICPVDGTDPVKLQRKHQKEHQR